MSVAWSPTLQSAVAAGECRNLFAEVGKPAEEVAGKLKAAYQQLFHGDPSREAVMYAAGSNERGPLAYILDVGHDDVRSEGMSYAMMIAVQMDEKRDFDALWNWALTYMHHKDPGHPAEGYFSWQLKRDGTPLDEMPAADGEEYFATALLFAGNRWGNGEGSYAYHEHARRLLTALRHRGTVTGTANGKSMTGVSLFHPENKMVRFTPDSSHFDQGGDHTNPSYHLPAFYELWALWGPEADAPFWRAAADRSREFFVESTNAQTALAPDYANYDGSPKAAAWDARTVEFRYDAWRTAMNWSVDAAWWAKDPRQTELSNRLLGFFSRLGTTYPNTFTIDGTPTSQSSSSGLVAMNAVATLAASHPASPAFIEALYRQSVPTGQWRYYDGMLYLLAMLHVSGEFRVHSPAL